MLHTAHRLGMTCIDLAEYLHTRLLFQVSGDLYHRRHKKKKTGQDRLCHYSAVDRKFFWYMHSWLVKVKWKV